MNGLIFLTVICIVYYCVYKYYPQYIEQRYHYYLGGFVLIYLFIIYMFSYENEFMYKMFKNIHGTNKQSLYSNDYNSLNPNQDLKSMLTQKQGNRCSQCQNYIMMKDIEYYKLKYLVSLQQGGDNDINNLGVVCPNCMF